jgi:YD repeat-containing protein
MTEGGDGGNPSPLPLVTEYIGGGGSFAHVLYPATLLIPQFKDRTVMVRLPNGSLEKRFADGSKYIFAETDGTGVAGRIFLSSVRDSAGNELTLHYSFLNNPRGVRLDYIIDATGHRMDFYYDYTDLVHRLQVTRVTDPFGRLAIFTYDNGRLVTITDAAQIQSQFTYETDEALRRFPSKTAFIKALTTPYGTTQFDEGVTPNGTAWYVQAADALGGIERVESRMESSIPDTEGEVPTGFGDRNFGLSRLNSFYWDKKAMEAMPGAAAHPALLDYTKAHVYHWLKKADTEEWSGVLAGEKRAGQSRIWYSYKNQTDLSRIGTSSAPAQVARLVDASPGQAAESQISTYGHDNFWDKLTKYTDPLGRITILQYDPNNQIDLLHVRQMGAQGFETLVTLGDYENYRPATLEGTNGRTTSLTFNAHGQPQTALNARAELSTLHYFDDPADVNTPRYGKLKSIVIADGTPSASKSSFTYDGFARLQTATDQVDAYTRYYAYDAIDGNPLQSLDRLTKVTYPDTTYEEITYLHLDPEYHYDRDRRPTHVQRDALRRARFVTDPENRTTEYQYCTCGAIEQLIDAAGHVTTWNRDLLKRPIEKIINSKVVATYTYEPRTSRLAKVTDALGQITSHGYFVDNNLKSITYTGALQPTPNVTFAYDPLFDRLTTASSSTGDIAFTYVPIGSDGALSVQTTMARSRTAPSPTPTTSSIASWAAPSAPARPIK